MSEENPKETLTEQAIEQLTADIVNGRLPPEQKLLIADLKTRYGMGASPLREALAKLSSLGFVVFDSRRGFRVAAISREDLQDITKLRQVIESAALRSSIEHGDNEWEVGIVAAFARLERLAAQAELGQTPASGDLERAHRELHRCFIAACGSPRMIGMQQLLYEQAQRYRHLMMREARNLDEFVAVHKHLADAVLSRDADRACRELSEHLELTMQMVYGEERKKADTHRVRRGVATGSRRGKTPYFDVTGE